MDKFGARVNIKEMLVSFNADYDGIDGYGETPEEAVYDALRSWIKTIEGSWGPIPRPNELGNITAIVKWDKIEVVECFDNGGNEAVVVGLPQEGTFNGATN